MKRFALFLAAGLALAAGGAYAASSGVDGQPMRPPGTSGTSSIQPGFVGGIYESDTTVRVLRFDIGGNLLTSDASRDRDYWILQNAGLQATDIPARNVFKSQVPFSISDFSALTLMVSWAASDTDTVAMEIAIVGKQSGNPADGLDYIVDMNPTVAAPFAADGISIFNAAGQAGYAAMSSARSYLVPKSGIVTSVTQGPLTAVNATTTVNAISIPLTELLGSYLNLPIIQIWVFNKKSTQMDDVTIDYWAKVR